MGAWEQLVASPGDLAATRVWADALTEKGDPQGEDIALRCALEELLPDDPRRRAMLRTCDHLEGRHGRTWLGRLWTPGDRDASPGLFRGLPFRLGGNLPALLAAKHLALRPIAALDAQYARKEDVAALAKLPQLKNLVELGVRQYTGEVDLAPVLESPHLGPLRVLALQGAAEDTVGRLGRLAALRTLALGGFVFTDAHAAKLLKALPALTALRIDRSTLSPEGLASLLDGRTLHTLDLRDSGFGPKHLDALLAHPKATALRVLALEGAALGKKGLQQLGAAKPLAALHTLGLSAQDGAKSGLEKWTAFFSGFALTGLRSLDLSRNALRPDGAKLLAKTSALALLEELDLQHCYLGDAGAAELAKSKHLGSLKVLNLGSNSIKGAGMPALAKGPLLKSVELIHLSHNKFGTDGGKALGAGKHLGALRKLILGHNWMGVLGMRALLANPVLAGLEEIRSGDNNFGSEVLASYVKAKAELGLLHLRAPEARKKDLLALAKLPGAARLIALELPMSPELDDEVAAAFVASPHLKDLGLLTVFSANVTARGRELLAAHYGPRLA